MNTIFPDSNFDGRKVLLATMFVSLAFGAGIFDGIVSFFESIASAIAAFANAIGNAFAAAGRFLFGGAQTVANDTSQTYSTTVNFVSDASSHVFQSISHTFTFSNPIQSISVSLVMHNVASMHFRQIQIDFHVAGKTFTVPITNPNSGPDIAVDQVIPLPSPLSVIGITADVSGVLCGSSCSNLTFTPSADLIASVPPSSS
jgi:hypothetical protein